MFEDLVEELIVADDDALIAGMRDRELVMRRLRAEQAAMAREVERRGLFSADGHRSVKGFLKANLNWSNSEAADVVKVARLLDTVPGAGDALWSGRIGVVQAGELARLRANPRVGDRLCQPSDPGDDEAVVGVLLDAAEQLKFEDFRIVCQRWETLADTDGAAQREAKNVEHRDVTMLDTDAGVFLRGSGGTALGAAEMVAVFESFVEHEFAADVAARDELFGPNAPAALLPRSAKQRRFDAMLNVFRAADAASSAGVVSGPVATVVNIVVSQFDLEHALNRAGLIPTPTDLTAPRLSVRRKETVSGSPVADDELVRAVVHGRVRAVVMDNTGMPTSFGRLRRLFTGPIRDVIRLLGHRCSHPGCDVPVERCEIDHVIEFGDGGETCLANGGIECSGHNPFKHRSKLTRHRVGPDQVVTTRADGTIMSPVGQPTPVRSPHDLLNDRLDDLPGTA